LGLVCLQEILGVICGLRRDGARQAYDRWQEDMPVVKSPVSVQLGMLFLIGTVLVTGCAASARDEVESGDPIILTMNDWTAQHINTRIMGNVLRRAGYTVIYRQADYVTQFAGLQSGELHIAMEIWETTGKQAMEKSLETGKTVDLGETGMQAIEEWWFPSYMKEKCPGLPDWKALNDCATVFSTAETAPKGRYLAGPKDWGGFDVERVKALGLNYEVVHADTDERIFAELRSAYEGRRPWLGWVYEPHWATIRFKGEWVKFPRYADECYKDPAWGVNPKMAYDCGKPRGWIKKIGWKAGERKWPCAYEVVRKFKIDNRSIGEMAGQVDLDGKTVDDVVDQWLADNERIWKPWIACAAKK
jgi:glycine betaine/proline transport system substrate-binding protein